MNGLAFLLSLLSAIFFPGIISVTKAKLSGRKAPSVFQPMFDILRLFKKSMIYSSSTSFIFQVAPVVYFVSVFFALFFLPFGAKQGIFAFGADFVFIAYLLAAGKFFMILSAMDTASPFEGMGANREAFYSMLVEPVFFTIMATFSLLTDRPSLAEFYSQIHSLSSNPYLYWLIIGFVVYIFFQITLTENSRLPIDDPKTHLELTMVHEVMVLDNSGFDLGLIQLTNALKFTFFGGLIANLFLDPRFSLGLNAFIFLVIEFLFAAAIGFSESCRARNKLAKNPLYLLTLLALTVLFFFMILSVTTKLMLT